MFVNAHRVALGALVVLTAAAPIAQAANGGTVSYTINSVAPSGGVTVMAGSPANYNLGALMLPTVVSLSDVNIGVGAGSFQDNFLFQIPNGIAASGVTGEQIDFQNFSTFTDVSALTLVNWTSGVTIEATANPSGNGFMLPKTTVGAGAYALEVFGTVQPSSIGTNGGSSAQYSGSLVIVPVPEPSTGILAAIALLGLAMTARLRRRTQAS